MSAYAFASFSCPQPICRQALPEPPSSHFGPAHSVVERASAPTHTPQLSLGNSHLGRLPILRAVSEQTAQEPDIRTVLEQVRNSNSTEAETRYREGSEYLRLLGFNSSADILRILDVAMARPLGVESDMKPVVNFLEERGLAKQAIKQVISEHPPVLCYSLEERLKPFFDYLEEIGIEQPGKTIQARPTLLGLEADKNLRKIVDYLQHNEYTHEQIVSYMETSL